MKFAFLAAALAVLAAGPAFAQGCDLIIASQVKGLSTPTRSTMTFTMNGKSYTIVSIAVGTKVYTAKADGTWQADTLGTNEDKIRKTWSAYDCTSGGSDTIDGELADIVLHHDDGKIPMDTRFWISRATGLGLRTETTMPNGSLISVYDYKDVQVPAP